MYAEFGVAALNERGVVVSSSAPWVCFSTIYFFSFSFVLDFLLLDSGERGATNNQKLANRSGQKL